MMLSQGYNPADISVTSWLGLIKNEGAISEALEEVAE